VNVESRGSDKCEPCLNAGMKLHRRSTTIKGEGKQSGVVVKTSVTYPCSKSDLESNGSGGPREIKSRERLSNVLQGDLDLSCRYCDLLSGG